MQPLTCEEGFVDSRFRESRDQAGRLTFLSRAERLRAIAALPVLDVEKNETIHVSDLAPAN